MTEQVGTAFKTKQRMKNSPSCAHVLYKTLNLAISRCCFAKDGKEMYQNLKTLFGRSQHRNGTKIYDGRAGPLFLSLNSIVL